MDEYTLLHGDCLAEMAAMDAGSVDAVVCDPPYGLEFMGKEWDRLGAGTDIVDDTANRDGNWTTKPFGGGGKRVRYGSSAATMQTWHQAWATEALRVLKPSHYLLAFGGTRTWHRLACAIEDAGFEIRDTLMWLYGSGFPKGKASLKPAWEPIILARKPGPMRELGIEECRIEMQDAPTGTALTQRSHGHGSGTVTFNVAGHEQAKFNPSGRWPANLILECTCDETREGTAKTQWGQATEHGTFKGWTKTPGPKVKNIGYADADGKEPVRIHTDPNCPCAMLDGQTGTLKSGAINPRTVIRPPHADSGFSNGARSTDRTYVGDSGGASRFFYCAKSSRSERNKGCEGLEPKVKDADYRQPTGDPLVDRIHGCGVKATNHHPTVKPLALMRWLVRLVARPGDVVLDPFMGSGTTGVACAEEGREFIGIERELDYIEIARRRIAHASAQGRLPLDESPPLPPVAGRPT